MPSIVFKFAFLRFFYFWKTTIVCFFHIFHFWKSSQPLLVKSGRMAEKNRFLRMASSDNYI